MKDRGGEVYWRMDGVFGRTEPGRRNLQSILTDIDRRYVIGYYPTNRARDGKRRKVQIEIRNHPEYVVWGQKTYFAREERQQITICENREIKPSPMRATLRGRGTAVVYCAIDKT